MSRIHPTAVVSDGAELDTDVAVGAYSVIGKHVRIGARTRIMAHVCLDGHTTIGPDCTIYPFVSLGSEPQDLKYQGAVSYVEIGARTILREYVTVNSGTNEGDITGVGNDCYIMAYSHVAHQCKVGHNVIMANAATLAGHVTIEDYAVIGGLCGIHQFTRIGRMAIVGGCSKVTQDILPYMMADGNPAKTRGINSVGMQRHNLSEATRRHVKTLYKILYHEKLNMRQAVEKIQQVLPVIPEIQTILKFIETSTRGITR